MKLTTILLAMLPALLHAQPGAELIRSIRDVALDPAQCYVVRDLPFLHDDIKLFFNDGYLIFAQAIASPDGSKRVAAIFAGYDEPADGELLVLPPTTQERQSLAKHTHTPNLDEHFHAATLSFTDGSAELLLKDIQAQGRRAPAADTCRALAAQWQPRLAAITGSMVQRIASDLLPANPGQGFLFAELESDRLGAIDVMADPLADDQILVGQLAQHDGAYAYDIWTSFPSRAERKGNIRTRALPATLSDYRISATLDDALHLQALTRATVTIGLAPVRAFAFALSRAEQITAVRLDGTRVEVLSQDSDRTRALRASDNDVFLVMAPSLLTAGSVHSIEMEHEGSVIEDRGSGVYAVNARSNWYPRNALEFATYELDFRYPAQLTLVTPGEVGEDRLEGNMRFTRRRTLEPIRIAGFNLGHYTLASKKSKGITVNVYGNRALDPALAPRPRVTVIPPVMPLYRGGTASRSTTIIQTPLPADPVARLRSVADDVSAELDFYAARFGPPPLPTLTIAPMPGTFGQGFPGLIYLSTLAYLDEAERPENVRNPRMRTFFTDLMVAHEVAHQWWGNLVAARTYQDEWIEEALAQYSALMWIEKKRGAAEVDAELSAARADLLAQGQDAAIVDSIGPLVWGPRLEESRNAGAWRAITYGKGAWVFHMLRQRMGDTRFLGMLAELRRRYAFRSLTTRALQDLVAEFAAKSSGPTDPPPAPADTIAAFFDSWVRGTEIPAVRIRGTDIPSSASARITGTLEFTGAPADFATEIPLEIQFSDGTRRVEWVRMFDRESPFALTLPRAPSRIRVATALTLATER